MPDLDPTDPASAGRTWPLGKRYDGGVCLVTEAAVAEYCDAIGDRRSTWVGPGAVAPPMFHARVMRDLLFAVMQDAELGLDFRLLLHAAHDARFHFPLRPGQAVTCRGELRAVEERPHGLRLRARLVALHAGEVAVDADSVFFVRRSALPSPPPPPPLQPPAAPPPPPDLELPLRVPVDQSLRYARASGDDNPLHTDPAWARAAGLPDVVVHGLCTMALAGDVVVRALAATPADDDPRRLSRLAVRWARPVANGQALAVRVWRGPLGGRFEVVDAAGHAVITQGIAELGGRT
ncbi:MaoC family dehydratase N-terminal domain-containing protein [Myxococcota bacterium]|nr:MaoC family dehydratase N-terminal domain-containing protein [Myxococcota bacterium]